MDGRHEGRARGAAGDDVHVLPPMRIKEKRQTNDSPPEQGAEAMKLAREVFERTEAKEK